MSPRCNFLGVDDTGGALTDHVEVPTNNLKRFPIPMERPGTSVTLVTAANPDGGDQTKLACQMLSLRD